MNTQERVIDKIRGLMAKAESSEFEEERNAFLDKATELMAKHRVDMAMLQLAGNKADDPVETRLITLTYQHIPKQGLLAGTCTLFDIHAIRSGKKNVSLIGHKSDLDMYETLFVGLELQLDRELTEVQGDYNTATKSVRSAFAKGWVSRVCSRMNDHYSRQQEEAVSSSGQSESVALVLASREETVSAKYQELYGVKPRYQTRRQTYRSYSDYSAGYEAGGRADIGQGGINGSRGSLTS